uniref:CCHC-type domain-containing protein n=1 Tax=Magallana gigas TaxID=29159 RepID=A0A8W8MJJ2_MAGGI
MIDEEISFLEQSCDRLRKEIERFSTPRERRTQARDSGIATLNGANGGQYYDPENTVVLQANEERDGIDDIERTSHVTVRRAKAHSEEKRGDLRMIESDESAQPQTTQLMDLMKAMQTKLDKLEIQVQNGARQRRPIQTSGGNLSNGVVCYYCKEKGHIRRNCPSLKSRGADKKSEPYRKCPGEGKTRRIRSNRRKNKCMNANIGANTSNHEAGIFLQTKVNEVQAKRRFVDINIKEDIRFDATTHAPDSGRKFAKSIKCKWRCAPSVWKSNIWYQDVSQTIYKDTTIAKMTAIDAEKSTARFEKQSSGELREDLRDLLDRVRLLHSSTEVEDNKNVLASASLRGSHDESKDIQLVRKWIDLGKRPSFSDVSQHGGEDNSDNEPENKGDLQIGDSSPHDDVHIEETEPFISVEETGASGNCQPRRDRNAPKWLQDYEVDYSG